MTQILITAYIIISTLYLIRILNVFDENRKCLEYLNTLICTCKSAQLLAAVLIFAASCLWPVGIVINFLIGDQLRENLKRNYVRHRKNHRRFQKAA